MAVQQSADRGGMRRNVGILAVAQALMMSCNSLIITSAALVGHTLTTVKSFATLPVALQFLFTMLTAVPASLLMGRIGRRNGFLIGNGIGITGAVLATAAIVEGSFLLFCLGTTLVGVFNGFANYYRFAAADVADDAFRSRAISYVLAGGVVAAFAGPGIARHTQGLIDGAPFAASFAVVAGLLVVSMTLLGMTRIPMPGHRAGGGRPVGAILRQPTYLVAVTAAALGYAVMSLVMTATPLAMHSMGHGFGETATVIQWHVFAMFAPAFFTGSLIARVGILPVLFTGALFNIACVVINLTGDSVAHYWTALFLLGLGWNFLFVGGTTLLTETYFPEEEARAQGLNDFLVFSAVTAAALSAGALQHLYGWQAVNLGVLPLIGIIVAALLWLMVLRARTTGPDLARG